MKIIGEKLKASREEGGLSLEEVSEDLKISIVDLNNLENGDKNAFSDTYLLKKYIYDYAKYLGLDYEHLIEEFNEFMFEYTSKIPVDVIERISKQKEKEEASKQGLSPYTVSRSKNNKKILFIGIAVLLIIAMIIGIVIIKEKNNSNVNSAIAALI